MRNHVTPAGVESPETGGPGEFKCAAEFVVGNATVDFGEARFSFGFVRRITLIHDVDVGVARQIVSDPLHDFARVIEKTRHDKMAHEDAAQRQTVLVHFKLTDLRVHGCDDFARRSGVIAGHEIFSAMLAVPKFEIGHIDVHYPIHPLDAFEAIVSRGVIHERQTQTALDRDYERFQDLRHHVLGRDEISVVAAALLQIDHDLCEFNRCDFGAVAELAGLEILAENAA